MAGTWVDPALRTPAWYVFNKLFKCQVSNIQSQSIEYLKYFGMPAVGDKQIDEDTAHQLITRMLTIEQMAEFYKQGVSVYVVKIEDTKEIYELISNHLQAWKTQLENGFNVRGAPVDDLILLDKFANTVYKHARHQFTTEIVESIISRQMSSTLRVSRNNVLQPLSKSMNNVLDPNAPPPKQEEPKWPEHPSMNDLLVKHRMKNGGFKWK